MVSLNHLGTATEVAQEVKIEVKTATEIARTKWCRKCYYCRIQGHLNQDASNGSALGNSKT